MASCIVALQVALCHIVTCAAEAYIEYVLNISILIFLTTSYALLHLSGMNIDGSCIARTSSILVSACDCISPKSCAHDRYDACDFSPLAVISRHAYIP